MTTATTSVRRSRRLLWRGAAALVLLLLLWQAARWGAQQRAWRQIGGPLRFDEAALPAGVYAVGQFNLLWNPNQEQLAITHDADPAHFVWSSVPGRGFVAAARGVETVEEARGSFFISDDLQTTCGEQTIVNIVRGEGEARIQGTLRCSDGETVRYELAFVANSQQENQLGFQLLLEDETLNRSYLTYASTADEHFFGFGEQFSYFDLKGKRLPIFVQEQGIGRGAEPITTGANLQARAGGDWHTSYAGVPHYISSDLRSLFLETTAYVVFDMRRRDRVQIQLHANQLVGRILYGPTPPDLIREYTSFAGRMRLLPPWILSGAVVGMQGGTDRVREVYAQLMARDVPVAAFWLQDWVGQRTTTFGSQLWWNWELDEERYPGWDALLADLAADDVRVLTYVSPFLADVSDKENARRNLFQEAAEQGFLVRDRSGAPYLIENTSFSAGMLDLTNPDARIWFATVLTENVIGAGASGWMADFGEALPLDAVLFSGDDAALYHNIYPEAWALLNRETIESLPDSEAYLFFTRSGYTRSPGFSTLFWLGDQLVSWDEHDGIKTAVTGLLSSGLSGYAFNHSDIGGYTTISNPLRDYHRSEELLLRWMELNAFTTVFRTHEGNMPAANVQFYSNERTLDHFARMAQVYAAWGFYRTSLVAEAGITGLPVVRHPFVHYPDDPAVYDIRYEQFMVGSELMVAPVVDEGATQVRVYLPAGRWTHLWSGETLGSEEAGASFTVDAPLGEPAVFYRSGSPVGAQLEANLAAAGLLPAR